MSAAFYQDEVKFYVAVDCIILGFNNKELNVLLYKRSFEPMKGQWSLMGGFVKSGESVDEAASRVLTDCTGIEHLFMEQIGAYGDVSRDLNNNPNVDPCQVDQFYPKSFHCLIIPNTTMC